MALGVVLARARTPPEHLHTDATVHFDSEGEGWAISHIELDVHGRVPGVDEAAFEQAARTAERHCPVSKALAGTRIELRAKLDG